jgi:hypothetical protein
MTESQERKLTETSLPSSKFAVGDKVSWDVGSDIYVGIITYMGHNQIKVDRGTVYKADIFTLRRDGEYRLLGLRFGRLRLGGEAYRDPSF